jgi:DNA-binding ferritin-like protein
MTVEELFGTLQQSIVGAWRKHLRTAKYGKHEALDEFYKEMPEKVDALIEAWMGANGKKIGKFENKLDSANYNTLKYLGELKKKCKEGYTVLGDNDELKSLLDDIINLINSTLYKVKELSESKGYKDLADFINEAMISEAKNQAVISANTFAHIIKGSEWDDLSKSEQNDVIDELSSLYNQHSYELVNKCKGVKLTYSKKDGIIISGLKTGKVKEFAEQMVDWLQNDCKLSLYRDDLYAILGDILDFDYIDEICDDKDID